jgi:hypothetical protein
VSAWNAFLARHRGPTVFSISIDRVVCRGTGSPCDDRLRNGDPARPDGIHYSDAAGRHVASRVFAAALRAAHLSK